jgi:transposase
MKNFILLTKTAIVGRSVSKSKYWKDCPKCGLKMTYGQLVTEEWYCWNCNHRGVF